MKTKPEIFYAWAIKTNHTDIDLKKYHGFIGRYWWKPVSKHLEGCRIALFTTKKIAKIYLPEVKCAFPKASIVKVKATVKEGK